MTRVLIIGVGGIGSQLIDILVPALTAGDLTKNSGGVIISVMDDDRVEISNISHQRHEPRMVGQLKVESILQRQSPFLSHSLRLIPIPERLENSSQLVGFDLVVVAVDNSRTRQLVHNYADKWLDLRCGSDGYISLDNTLDHELVERLTPHQSKPASCQLPGALENSNVEVGYALAAAHGVQWIIQNIRRNVGVNTYPPPPGAFSLTHGIIPLFDALFNRECYDTLRTWRRITYREEGHVGAYVVAPNRTLEDIARKLPVNIEQLSQCHGIGPARLSNYGEAILEIVRYFLDENDISIQISENGGGE
jgi:hypothetical protein